MRQRRTTVPPTQAASRASASTRKKLIARGKKTEKRSDKKRTALDDRFHRTLRISGFNAPARHQQPTNFEWRVEIRCMRLLAGPLDGRQPFL